jgi:hypothetical protein
MPRLSAGSAVCVIVSVFALACDGGSPTAPRPERSPAASQNNQLGSTPLAWGPEIPPFNLQAVLRGDGFGLVKFRQPNDGDKIVYLDVWVRDLLPAASYSLQRAVDPELDGHCTSSSWLTLGTGLTPESILTDGSGTGRAELWRNLDAFATGATFDIHFRVIQNSTSPEVVALESDCYRFVISQ